jgi:hypothetical protein
MSKMVWRLEPLLLRGGSGRVEVVSFMLRLLSILSLPARKAEGHGSCRLCVFERVLAKREYRNRIQTRISQIAAQSCVSICFHAGLVQNLAYSFGNGCFIRMINQFATP